MQETKKVSAYNYSCVSIIQSYDYKQVHIGLLHAEKMPEIVLLTVFKVEFPASLLRFIYHVNLECHSANFFFSVWSDKCAACSINVGMYYTALWDSLIVVFTMWLDSVLLTCLFTDFGIGCM